MSAPAELPLAQRIRAEIASDGPISFRRFMELALYDERLGYYGRWRRQRPREGAPSSRVAAAPKEALGAFRGDPFGASGDYFTNSQLQPVFGRLIAQQITRWRDKIGSTGDLLVAELGPGRGETTVVLTEHLPLARVVGLDYGSSLEDAGPAQVVISNEFFDALPVHSVERRGGGIVEHYVEADGDGFRFHEGPPSNPRLAEYLERYAPGLADGQRIEVNLAALDWLERIAATLDRGYVLTIDYGYTAEQIAGGRRFPSGSLMSYVKHRASENVLADPGSRDITAHVNFTALELRGAELGLECQGLRTQARFLMDVGEPDQFAAALQAGSEQESFQLRMQLKTLLFGLGETFQVLVQEKK